VPTARQHGWASCLPAEIANSRAHLQSGWFVSGQSRLRCALGSAATVRPTAHIALRTAVQLSQYERTYPDQALRSDPPRRMSRRRLNSAPMLSVWCSIRHHHATLARGRPPPYSSKSRLSLVRSGCSSTPRWPRYKPASMLRDIDIAIPWR
jgi:hypothetical protein